ncbi:hypothetical protein BZA77DRAFT_373484 [Pyronema omphalodes]|nr:hypothetical protein BZA77DRAFT_373484 [Pyronema omphalodes]
MTGKTPECSQHIKNTRLPKLAPRDGKGITSFENPSQMSKDAEITQSERDMARETTETTIGLPRCEESHFKPPEDSFTKITNALLHHQQNRPGATTTPGMAMLPSKYPGCQNDQGVHASSDALQTPELTMRLSTLSGSGDLPTVSKTTPNQNGIHKEAKYAAPTVPIGGTSLHDRPSFLQATSPVQSPPPRRARSHTTSKNPTTQRNSEPKRLENLIAMHNEITQRQKQPTTNSSQHMSKPPRYSSKGSSNNGPIVTGQNVQSATARNITPNDTERLASYITGQPQNISATERPILARQSLMTPRTVHIDDMPWTNQESNPYHFAVSSANDSIAAIQQQKLQRNSQRQTQQITPPEQQYLGMQYRIPQNTNTATFHNEDSIDRDQLLMATASGISTSNMDQNNAITNRYQVASNQAHVKLGRRKRQQVEPLTSKRPKLESTSISTSQNNVREAYQPHQLPGATSSTHIAVSGTAQQRDSIKSANRAKLAELYDENYIREKEEELRRRHLNQAKYLPSPRNSNAEIPRGRKSPTTQSVYSKSSKSAEITPIQSPLQNPMGATTGSNSPLPSSITQNLRPLTPGNFTKSPRLPSFPAAVPLRQGPEHTQNKHLEYTNRILPPFTEFSTYFPQEGLWVSNMAGHVRRIKQLTLADCLKAAAARHKAEGTSVSQVQFPVVLNEFIPEFEGAQEDAQN